MAMSKRPRSRQQELFVQTSGLPQSPGHPFYEKLNEILAAHGFDDFVEELVTLDCIMVADRRLAFVEPPRQRGQNQGQHNKRGQKQYAQNSNE